MAGPRIDVVTIFPELLEHFLEGSLLGAARREGSLTVKKQDNYLHVTIRSLGTLFMLQSSERRDFDVQNS